MRRAHLAVREAIKSGVLVRPDACQKCGKVGKLHGHHHRGYEGDARLDVVWLCPGCHRFVHRRAACKNGHALTGDNVMTADGTRRCRECWRTAQRELMRKRREARGVIPRAPRPDRPTLPFPGEEDLPPFVAEDRPNTPGPKRQPYCQRGHPMRGANVMQTTSGRRCRACYRAAQKRIMRERRRGGK